MNAAGIPLLCGLCETLRLCAKPETFFVSRRGAEEAEIAEDVVL